MVGIFHSASTGTTTKIFVTDFDATHVIDAATITTALLASAAITAVKVASNVLTTNLFASGVITTAILASGSIVSPAISSNSITTNLLASGIITTAIYASNSITTNALASAILTNAIYVASSITTDKISTTLLSKVTSTSNPSATQTISFSGLDGSAHMMYVIHGRLLNSSSAAHVFITFNGDTSTSYDRYSDTDGTLENITSTNQISLGWSDNNNRLDTNEYMHFEIVVFAETGVNRSMKSWSQYKRSVDTSRRVYHTVAYWNNSTTNMTTITFSNSATLFVATGSLIHIYSMPS